MYFKTKDYSFIAITPRSTLMWTDNKFSGPMYDSNKFV